MPKQLTTYSKRSSRSRPSPIKNAGSQKRKVDLLESNQSKSSSRRNAVSRKQEVNLLEPNDETTNPVPEPAVSSSGLDWSLVSRLDQDATGQSHFPARFEPPVHESFLGDDNDKPDLSDNADLNQYSAWVLARVKKMRVSNVVTSMINDPNV
ncbi:hypothetical protein F4776DRAFT_672515 [Hypoxylon sp. NC0597]|nr:hypothetical protein F4776DRAFT_672515 [Hypoxylon sp. NC0597]